MPPSPCGARLPQWVISVGSMSAACPQLLRSLPKCCVATNVERGHKATSAHLLDHFVGTEKCWRDGKAECPRGLKADDQFELRR